MAENNASSIKAHYEVGSITPELLKPVLHDLPRPSIRRREYDYKEADMPQSFRKLGDAMSEFSGQPTFSTVILKRHNPGDPHSDNPRLHKEDRTRFSGRITLAGLIGMSHLIIDMSDPSQEGEEQASPHSIPFIVRSVVHLDATLPYRLSLPETPEPRYVLLFGNDLTKSAG
jgi:hypothetical protein